MIPVMTRKAISSTSPIRGEVFTTGAETVSHKGKKGGKKKNKTKVRTLDKTEVAETVKRNFEARGEVFDSGLEIIQVKDLAIRVPMVILAACNKIQEHVGKNEFSIFCKGRMTGRGYQISDQFVIPEQEIAGASVDYLDGDDGRLRAEGWNVVIHSHPFNMHSFSGSDRDTINSHFDCSVLYSEGKFVASILNLEMGPGVKMQIEPKLSVDINLPEITVDVTKFHERVYKSCYTKKESDEADIGDTFPFDRWKQFC